MKNFKLSLSVLIMCGLLSIANSQNALVTYTARTAYVQGWTSCNGQGNFTSFTFLSDNDNTAETSSGCQAIDGGNGTTYAVNTSSTTRTNFATRICSRLEAWEDNTGSRCSFDAGDDCLVTSTSCILYFRLFSL